MRDLMGLGDDLMVDLIRSTNKSGIKFGLDWVDIYPLKRNVEWDKDMEPS